LIASAPLPRIRGALSLLALLLLGALQGCLSQSATLTLPISDWPGYEYSHLAKEQGLDRSKQLELKLQTFHDPQGIVHAFLRGDLAKLTTVEAVDICARVPKRCPVVVLVLDESVGGDQVVVRPEIRGIPDLRQRPVAVTPSTLGPYVLSRALQKHGLSLEDVQIRPMPLPGMATSLKRGEVMGAALFPPFSDAALRDGTARTVFTSREIPGEIYDVLVVAPAFLVERPQEIARLLRVWQKAHEFAADHPERGIAVMAEREGVTPTEFRRALEGLRFEPLARQQALFRRGGHLENNLRSLQQVQVKLGLMEPGPIPPVDPHPLRLALKR
jgi:NitT/TauT family transport system substrate-binding protein